MRLEGKTAVITGAGSGLGRESALLFAQEGANIVVTDRIAARVERVTQEVIDQGGKAVGVTADVTVDADMEAACQAAVQQFGRLDIMFANAGIAPEGFGTIAFEDFTGEQWDAVNDVNLKGVFLACRHAVKVMKPQGGGTIVVTTSAGGIVAYPGFFAYCAGKGGANMLVHSMSYELGRFGIRANGLAPTHGMSVNLAMPDDADVLGLSYEEVAVAEAGGTWSPGASPIPLKLNRPPRLRDNANVALFLASDESQYMSGVVIPATDGGTLSRVAMGFEENWEQELAPES